MIIPHSLHLPLIDPREKQELEILELTTICGHSHSTLVYLARMNSPSSAVVVSAQALFPLNTRAPPSENELGAHLLDMRAPCDYPPEIGSDSWGLVLRWACKNGDGVVAPTDTWQALRLVNKYHRDTGVIKLLWNLSYMIYTTKRLMRKTIGIAQPIEYRVGRSVVSQYWERSWVNNKISFTVERAEDAEGTPVAQLIGYYPLNQLTYSRKTRKRRRNATIRITVRPSVNQSQNEVHAFDGKRRRVETVN